MLLIICVFCPYFILCISILETYGEVDIVPESISSTELGRNDILLAAALHDNNAEHRAHQSNGNLQPNAINNFLNASKTVLTSTITNLISTNNENIDDAITPAPLNYTTLYVGPTVCVNGTGVAVAPSPTNLSEIPTKEVIIVLLMLSLWIYSIHMTRRAWHRLLKE